MSYTNPLRAAWAAGRSTYGGWVSTPDPLAAEYQAAAGFDEVMADMQHGAIALRDLPALFAAIERHGVAPVGAGPRAGPARDLDLARHGRAGRHRADGRDGRGGGRARRGLPLPAGRAAVRGADAVDLPDGPVARMRWRTWPQWRWSRRCAASRTSRRSPRCRAWTRSTSGRATSRSRWASRWSGPIGPRPRAACTRMRSDGSWPRAARPGWCRDLRGRAKARAYEQQGFRMLTVAWDAGLIEDGARAELRLRGA